MRLVVLIQNRRFGIAAHARGAHFVNSKTGRGNVLINKNVFRARRSKHFCGLHGDIFRHGVLVVAPCAVNFQSGDAPGIELFFIHVDVIAVIRQALAETAHAHAPGAGHFERVFEIGANSGPQPSRLPPP